MKANAPEKLYLIQHNGLICYCRNNKDDIEYTRTDAFIEKTADWLFHQANYYTKLKIDAHNGGVYADFYADKMVEDFRNYMKGK